MTEAQWNAWTGWSRDDANEHELDNPSTKPTWAQLNDYWRASELDQYWFRVSRAIYNNAEHAEQTIGHTAVETDLTLSGALLARRIHNDEAGSSHEAIVLDKNKDGVVQYVRTPQELETEIDLARNDELRIKSAENIVRAALKADRDKLQDASVSLADREAAMARLKAATTQTAYLASIRAAIATLSAPPTNVAESRAWHIHNLERDGAARKRYVTGADSRQGDWLDHSCEQQRTAMDTINGHVQRGRIGIRRSATTTAIVREYTAAKALVEGVVVSGSAEWTKPPATAALTAATQTVTVDTSVETQTLGTWKCGNPTGTTGACAIESVKASNASVTWSITYVEDNGFITLTLNSNVALTEPFTVELEGRNACGPKALVLTFNPPVPSE